ncbi:FtsL-like putative cell division protein [uncultured Porphyromonas sp.]|uniref:FtsL-like putative cell division protein n=1 Tax=uncultured Porphyromonas sp. TaxID=159274 RepID=UPI002636AA2E|nr:FtsL-like putative cell division protein [uncultured Porphyromonas sp.]
MVKIDETYFDDNLEELQEPTALATDESVVPSEPKPLLGDLLEEDEAEATDVADVAVTEAEEPQSVVAPMETPYEEEPASAYEEEPADVPEVSLEERTLSDAAEADEDEEIPFSRKSSRGLWYWLGGDMLGQPTFRKYIPAFIAILLMALIHVTSNYQIISKRREIDKLEARVKDLTYKHMESVSELTRRSIGGNFEQQLQSMGSDLEAPSQQSIILYRDSKK